MERKRNPIDHATGPTEAGAEERGDAADNTK
jgi:hypothetical protein